VYLGHWVSDLGRVGSDRVKGQFVRSDIEPQIYHSPIKSSNICGATKYRIGRIGPLGRGAGGWGWVMVMV